jgi:hypothetical protein
MASGRIIEQQYSNRTKAALHLRKTARSVPSSAACYLSRSIMLETSALRTP